MDGLMKALELTAMILGIAASAITVLTIVSKKFRGVIGGLFKKYGRSDELSENIDHIRTMLEKHISDDEDFRRGISEINDIAIEFTKAQCRNIIKNVFYKYKDTKVLPLYEKKTLMSVEDLYIRKMNCNSFASLLLQEMAKWDVDYDSSVPEEEQDNR